MTRRAAREQGLHAPPHAGRPAPSGFRSPASASPAPASPAGQPQRRPFPEPRGPRGLHWTSTNESERAQLVRTIGMQPRFWMLSTRNVPGMGQSPDAVALGRDGSPHDMDCAHCCRARWASTCADPCRCPGELGAGRGCVRSAPRLMQAAAKGWGRRAGIHAPTVNVRHSKGPQQQPRCAPLITAHLDLLPSTALVVEYIIFCV